VDLTSGALLALTLQPADQGDTTTIQPTLEEAQSAAREINQQGVEEVVADKGYHSGAVLQDVHAQEIRSYISEPERGRRKWGEGKAEEQKRTYANRRRVWGARHQRLQKLRSELTERSFAHLYETGGMRRVHLQGRKNILKRLLVHGAAFNLSLILRKVLGVGKPRRLQGLSVDLFELFLRLLEWSRLLSEPVETSSEYFATQSNTRGANGSPASDVHQVACRPRAVEETLTTATGC
jgi:transposase